MTEEKVVALELHRNAIMNIKCISRVDIAYIQRVPFEGPCVRFV